ncbi:MAG: hypothetical protein BWZ08_02751 [candidate division BRC1 bacterium ADurb.BinA292]|nr:MAG: hypothetical protein BWZ08_02751 [candidate division BRC1 bacterium ADurb.BinA292]
MSRWSPLSGATIMSHVDVPMILTSTPGSIPEPTAPRCASNAPIATGVPAGSPSRIAHSAVSPPAACETFAARSGSVARTRASSGSSALRNSASGYPPHPGLNIALCPAAQIPRCSLLGCSVPVSTAGIQSVCSAHVWAAANTRGATRLQCSSFDQYHSDE